MANFNIEQALSEVKDSSTKQLIQFLLSENNKKSLEIITLRNYAPWNNELHSKNGIPLKIA